MSTKEKEMRFREAVRYLENASDILRVKAKKKDRYYQDEKYVRMACATAYNAVLLAVETYLETKGKAIKPKKGSRTNVKDFQKNLAALDNKVLNDFITSYQVLHLDGYYDGVTNATVIQEGMNSALNIVNQIKPIGFDSMSLN
jgi:uncharacterized protein (UPF0332 family)